METQRTEKKKIFTQQSMTTLISGGVGGVISRTCVSPFERLKILMQTQTVVPGQPLKYEGVIPSLKLMVHEDGYRGLFKGNAANVVRIFPTSGLQFFCFEQYKDLMGGEKDLKPHQRLMCGGAAGATAMLCTYPLEYVRGLLTVQTGNHYRGIVHAFQKVYAEDGVLAFYRGLFPALLGIVPFIGIEFAVYDILKKKVVKKLGYQDGKPGPLVGFACGCTAATCAQTAAYPFDLVRRRLNVQSFQESHYQYKGVTDAFVTIVKHEGVRALYKGMVPNLLKVAPAMGITFMTVETMKEQIALWSKN